MLPKTEQARSFCQLATDCRNSTLTAPGLSRIPSPEVLLNTHIMRAFLTSNHDVMHVLINSGVIYLLENYDA